MDYLYRTHVVLYPRTVRNSSAWRGNSILLKEEPADCALLSC
jgi:hypothetical protein